MYLVSIVILIQKNKQVEMEAEEFDPNDAFKSFDGKTYKAPQSDDQSPSQGLMKSLSPSPATRRNRGSSDLNNCGRRTVAAIKGMNKNVVSNLKDSFLNNTIKQVWLQFVKNPYRCKPILMALFNNQPDSAMMIKFGFGEWTKEENFGVYKKAMAKLKQLILDNMKHQALRLYLLKKERIKQQHQPMFLSYIWMFLGGDFRKGTIKETYSRQECLLIRQYRDKNSRDDEYISMYVISSGRTTIRSASSLLKRPMKTQ